QVFRRLRRRNKIMFGRLFFLIFSEKSKKQATKQNIFLFNGSFTDL
ncbi:MAG: hypothetical protein RL742_596, partial [Bacteroidota bacterium]